MIGAADHLAHVALPLDDLAAPVTADVVERPERPGLVPQDEQLVVQDPCGKEVPRLGEVRLQPRPHPAAVEQRPALVFQPGSVDVGIPRQELPGRIKLPCHLFPPNPSSNVRTHSEAASAAATRPRATWFHAVHTS